ncbi:hypothetical protein SSX86_017396 [Deinandra increscens subsp. villosa]|uniref:Uncharacterized protein n=1 Tax=Deinandra increscens subsp. villosa TaxID=3103831 RepID=A0AAP0GVM1_9ASTR
MQFDKYAPSDVKKLVADVQSEIYKTKPLLKLLLIIAKTIIIPLITITIFLLQTTKYLIQIITTTTPKSIPVVSTAQTPLRSAPLVGSIPLVGNVAQSLVPNPTNLANVTNSLVNKNPLLGAIASTAQSSLETTKSLVPDAILQKGLDSGNQAPDTTKSLFGGIPFAGNVAQSLVNNNPVLGAFNSVVNQAQDTTKSLVGGIPLVGDVAQSLVTNPTDLANEILETTNSLVNENPILEAVNSAANQAQDTTKSLVGSIPLVGDVAQSLVTNPTDLANGILNTTNSLLNENPLLEAVNSAAQNIGNKTQATGTKAVLQSAYMTMKLTWIPVIAQLWYELVNKYPWVGELSELILPVVEYVCELYNKVVTYMDEEGYSIFGYMPLIPIDEMKVAYKLVKTSRDGLSAVGDLLGMNNNKGLAAVGDLLGVNKNN